MKKILFIILLYPFFIISQSDDINSKLVYHNNKGNQFVREGQIELGLKEFDKAVELNPDYALGHINRGNAYYKLGDFERALSDYEYAININPVAIDTCIKLEILPNIYFYRGLAYAGLKKWQESLNSYSKAIELDSSCFHAYFQKGISNMALKNFKESIDDFSILIILDKYIPEAHMSRGICREECGLPYCDDYRKACYLGEEKACEWYKNQCK